jgi:2-polyprenyl-3-methyl-5-hydroxy-6-metoxy-1,4-benzoquinol methylase
MEQTIETFFFPCPICNSEEYQTIYGVSVFRVCACMLCGLVCLNPRMDEKGYMENLYKNYRKDLFGDYLAKDVDTKDLYDKPVESPAAEKTYSHIKKYLPKEAEILEVGCGVGQGLIVLKQNGFHNVMGIEPDLDEESCGLLKKLYDIECYNKSFSEFVEEYKGKKKFDCIILDQVIEHFVEPDKDISMMYELMAENGTLYIATPDLYKFTKPFSQFAIPHTFYFSRTTIEILLKKCGFRVEQYFDSLQYFSMTLLARREERIEPIAYDYLERERVLAYLKKNIVVFTFFTSKRFAEDMFIQVFGEPAYIKTRVFLKNLAVALIKKLQQR